MRHSNNNRKRDQSIKRSDLIIIGIIIIIFALLLFVYARWISERTGAEQPNATEKLSQKLDELINRIDQSDYMTKSEMEAALKSALNGYADNKNQTVVTVLPEDFKDFGDEEIKEIIEKALGSYYNGGPSEEEIINTVSEALAKKGSGLSGAEIEETVKEALISATNKNTDPAVISAALEKGGFGLTADQINDIVAYLAGNGGAE